MAVRHYTQACLNLIPSREWTIKFNYSVTSNCVSNLWYFHRGTPRVVLELRVAEVLILEPATRLSRAFHHSIVRRPLACHLPLIFQ
jgi:hypothetical protein